MNTTTSFGPRLLDAATPDHAEHLRRVGPLPDHTAEALLHVVRVSGLSGRGGAAFPSGRKLAAVAEGAARSVVVGNGAEGEPASSKDRVLLTHAPHLVLDGLVLAARAVGATETYLYAAADLLDGPVAAALRQRSDRVRCVAAPDTFVAGQESAVVSAVNGGPALPTDTLPPVFVRGVGARPTLVQNVETLAQIALITRHGPQWFRSVGTHDEPGTRLATVSGAVRNPGVYEVVGGAPLGGILAAAGGPSRPLRALLIGGYHGGWVPWSKDMTTLPWTRDALRRYEAAPGAGALIALPAERCGVRAGAEIAAYLAGQSAGQCGPCRNGLPAAADLLALLARGQASAATVRELERVVGLVDGRGACHHPGGTARLIRSTLRTFAGEVAIHVHGRCTGDVRNPGGARGANPATAFGKVRTERREASR